MVSCSVLGCKSRTERKIGGISFHAIKSKFHSMSTITSKYFVYKIFKRYHLKWMSKTTIIVRYFNLKYEKIIVNRPHLKSYTNISCKEKVYCVNSLCITHNIAISLADTGQQLRSLSSFKKKNQQKRPIESNESKKSKQMSESLQPNLNHVSYGGQFEISSDDGNAIPDWQNENSASGSSTDSHRKGPSSIPANFRFWEPMLKDNDIDGTAFRFKILSYNILAQYLLECHPYLYTDCSPHNLKWNVRAEKLFDEITSLAPDILCLQEVQASHLNSFYARFNQIGYSGIFKQKTGHRQDGCAIYFKQSLFEIIDHISVEFYQPELPILNRDNIGILVKLLPKNYPGPPIVVATTHLLYNPKRTDVRLAQIQMFLAEIDRFAYHSNGRESGYLPIILSGDLNSTPDSAVIKLLDRGHVSTSPFRDSSDWKRIGVTDNCQHLSVYLNRQKGLATAFNMTRIYNSDYSTIELASDYPNRQPEKKHSELFNSGVVGHSLKLASVYNTYKQNGHCEATTLQNYWVTVDYIYFSCCSNLRLLERFRLPTGTECDVLGRLPNDVYGSDHLLLAATFELKPHKSSL